MSDLIIKVECVLSAGYGPSEAHDRLLRPGYETIENGFVATKEGTTMIAVRTDMGDGEKGHLRTKHQFTMLIRMSCVQSPAKCTIGGSHGI